MGGLFLFRIYQNPKNGCVKALRERSERTLTKPYSRCVKRTEIFRRNLLYFMNDERKHCKIRQKAFLHGRHYNPHFQRVRLACGFFFSGHLKIAVFLRHHFYDCRPVSVRAARLSYRISSVHFFYLRKA